LLERVVALQKFSFTANREVHASTGYLRIQTSTINTPLSLPKRQPILQAFITSYQTLRIASISRCIADHPLNLRRVVYVPGNESEGSLQRGREAERQRNKNGRPTSVTFRTLFADIDLSPPFLDWIEASRINLLNRRSSQVRSGVALG
jgi:hypothetical protein